MKKAWLRRISIAILMSILLGFIPVAQNEAQAWTINQQNIADRADFFFNTTWVCQKTVYGWRDQYTFYEGETYHLPYGQPVNSGEFIGYGVELEDFLIAAADANSVFYRVQSEWSGWTSVYYATDCAAFVAMCWGTVRQDCSTIPYYSTYKGAANESNIHNVLQLGDALDSTSVGHVVLVTDMVYDTNGNLTTIEITEQTPPQLKRTLFTPAELAAKYGADYSIYRYEGSVPAVPEWGYAAECTNLASYCEVEITADTPIMSLPCPQAVNSDSVILGTAAAGTAKIATRLFENTEGKLWYRILMDDDSDGYIAAGDTIYKKQFIDDIQLTDAVYPNAHIRGKTFSLTGNIYARYNQLVTATGYIYKGFGTNTNAVTGYSDYVTSNAYTLKNSKIDYNTSFGDLTLGNHTIAYGVTYKNHYATGETTYEINTGTVPLAEEYFMVVSSSTNQNTCTHNYTETVISEGDCTTGSITVFACSRCGKVDKQTNNAQGHSYGEWTVSAATCTENGSQSRTCTICGNKETQVIDATGHNYDEKIYEGSCQEIPRTVYICVYCGDSKTYYPDEVMSPWQETLPEGVDEAMIETKTQYRYSDLEEITSDQDTLEGYTPLDSVWEATQVNTIHYVKSWPTGFDRSSDLYSEYENTPLTAFENDTQKLTVDSDHVTGYLYYHWCYPNSYYSKAESSGRYTTFHAYYSTVKPDTYRVDTSDWSYCTADPTCSNTEWYFVAEVNTQTSSNYQKLYRHVRWLDYSPWSDTPVEASDTRQVETRTVYRFVDASVAEHDYETITTAPGCTQTGSITYICKNCGDSYSEELAAAGHSYEAVTTEPNCTQAGSVVYTCSTCGDSYSEELAAAGHSYEAVTTEPNCTQAGSVVYTCSTCGDSYSEELAAAGHSYEAVTTEPDCTQAGSVVYTCSTCGDSYSDVLPAAGHDFLDGVCINCGETQQITAPTLIPRYPTLSFEDEVLINVYFTGADLDGISADNMGLLTWAAPNTNGTVENAEHVIKGATFDPITGLYCVQSQGIAAKNIGDDVYFKIFTRLDNGSYLYSDLLNYSPRTYAKTVLNSAGYSNEMKALVVAMLHYGAQAQIYFGYNPDRLTNNDLTPEQLALVREYQSDMVADVAPVNADKLGDFAPTVSGFTKKYPTISFESAFSINYYFTPEYVPCGDVTLYVWNQSDFENVEELRAENATEVIAMTGGPEYWAAVTGIAAKDIERTVYVAAVYQDTEGQAYCSGVLNYSLGAYCKIQASADDPIANFAAATAVYGYYAKAYFTK